jgi:hypothetical protein
MMRRLIRTMFRLALVIGAAAALYKVVQARRPSPELPEGDAWPPAPKPVRATPSVAAKPAAQKPVANKPATAKRAAEKPAPAQPAAAWTGPVDGACPATHPIKAKLSSSIYHLPGMIAYERTNPDRCYRDEESAEADGLRKAKR